MMGLRNIHNIPVVVETSRVRPIARELQRRSNTTIPIGLFHNLRKELQLRQCMMQWEMFSLPHGKGLMEGKY